MGACIARAGDAGGIGYVPAIGTTTYRAAGEHSQQHGMGQPTGKLPRGGTYGFHRVSRQCARGLGHHRQE